MLFDTLDQCFEFLRTQEQAQAPDAVICPVEIEFSARLSADDVFRFKMFLASRERTLAFDVSGLSHAPDAVFDVIGHIYRSQLCRLSQARLRQEATRVDESQTVRKAKVNLVRGKQSDASVAIQYQYEQQILMPAPNKKRLAPRPLPIEESVEVPLVDADQVGALVTFENIAEQDKACFEKLIGYHHMPTGFWEVPVIQAVQSQAMRQILACPEYFCGGVVAHNLPEGFYWQRLNDQDKTWVLCFDVVEAPKYRPRATAFTLRLPEAPSQPEGFPSPAEVWLRYLMASEENDSRLQDYLRTGRLDYEFNLFKEYYDQLYSDDVSQRADAFFYFSISFDRDNEWKIRSIPYDFSFSSLSPQERMQVLVRLSQLLFSYGSCGVALFYKELKALQQKNRVSQFLAYLERRTLPGAALLSESELLACRRLQQFDASKWQWWSALTSASSVFLPLSESVRLVDEFFQQVTLLGGISRDERQYFSELRLPSQPMQVTMDRAIYFMQRARDPREQWKMLNASFSTGEFGPLGMYVASARDGYRAVTKLAALYPDPSETFVGHYPALSIDVLIEGRLKPFSWEGMSDLHWSMHYARFLGTQAWRLGSVSEYIRLADQTSLGIAAIATRLSVGQKACEASASSEAINEFLNQINAWSVYVLPTTIREIFRSSFDALRPTIASEGLWLPELTAFLSLLAEMVERTEVPSGQEREIFEKMLLLIFTHGRSALSLLQTLHQQIDAPRHRFTWRAWMNHMWAVDSNLGQTDPMALLKVLAVSEWTLTDYEFINRRSFRRDELLARLSEVDLEASVNRWTADILRDCIKEDRPQENMQDTPLDAWIESNIRRHGLSIVLQRSRPNDQVAADWVTGIWPLVYGNFHVVIKVLRKQQVTLRMWRTMHLKTIVMQWLNEMKNSLQETVESKETGRIVRAVNQYFLDDMPVYEELVSDLCDALYEHADQFDEAVLPKILALEKKLKSTFGKIAAVASVGMGIGSALADAYQKPSDAINQQHFEQAVFSEKKVDFRPWLRKWRPWALDLVKNEPYQGWLVPVLKSVVSLWVFCENTPVDFRPETFDHLHGHIQSLLEALSQLAKYQGGLSWSIVHRFKKLLALLEGSPYQPFYACGIALAENPAALQAAVPLLQAYWAVLEGQVHKNEEAVRSALVLLETRAQALMTSPIEGVDVIEVMQAVVASIQLDIKNRAWDDGASDRDLHQLYLTRQTQLKHREQEIRAELAKLNAKPAEQARLLQGIAGLKKEQNGCEQELKKLKALETRNTLHSSLVEQLQQARDQQRIIEQKIGGESAKKLDYKLDYKKDLQCIQNTKKHLDGEWKLYGAEKVQDAIATLQKKLAPLQQLLKELGERPEDERASDDELEVNNSIDLLQAQLALLQDSEKLTEKKQALQQERLAIQSQEASLQKQLAEYESTHPKIIAALEADLAKQKKAVEKVEGLLQAHLAPTEALQTQLKEIKEKLTKLEALTTQALDQELIYNQQGQDNIRAKLKAVERRLQERQDALKKNLSKRDAHVLVQWIRHPTQYIAVWWRPALIYELTNEVTQWLQAIPSVPIRKKLQQTFAASMRNVSCEVPILDYFAQYDSFLRVTRSLVQEVDALKHQVAYGDWHMMVEGWLALYDNHQFSFEQLVQFSKMMRALPNHVLPHAWQAVLGAFVELEILAAQIPHALAVLAQGLSVCPAHASPAEQSQSLCVYIQMLLRENSVFSLEEIGAWRATPGISSGLLDEVVQQLCRALSCGEIGVDTVSQCGGLMSRYLSVCPELLPFLLLLLKNKSFEKVMLPRLLAEEMDVKSLLLLTRITLSVQAEDDLISLINGVLALNQSQQDALRVLFQYPPYPHLSRCLALFNTEAPRSETEIRAAITAMSQNPYWASQPPALPAEALFGALDVPKPRVLFDHFERVAPTLDAVQQLLDETHLSAPFKEKLFKDVLEVQKYAEQNAHLAQTDREAFIQQVRAQTLALKTDSGPGVTPEKLRWLSQCREVMALTSGIYLNTTQLIAFLLALYTGDKTLLQMSTGQGKGFMTALFAALLWTETTTVNALSSNAGLLRQDFEKKGMCDFFQWLGIPARIITVAEADDYQPGFVYYLTPYDRAFIQSERLLGQKENSSLRDEGCVADEADWLLLCMVGVSFDYVKANSRDNVFQWVYPLVLEFIARQDFLNIDEASPTRWSEAVDLRELNQHLLASGLTAAQQVQLEGLKENKLNRWINAACEARQMVEGQFIVLPERDRPAFSEAVPVVQDVLQVGGKYSGGVHEFLHTALMQDPAHRDEQFEISPELTCSDTDSPLNMVTQYKRLIGLSGTMGVREERLYLMSTLGVGAWSIPKHEPSLSTLRPPVLCADEKAQHLTMCEGLQKLPIDASNGRMPVLIVEEDAPHAKALFDVLKADLSGRAPEIQVQCLYGSEPWEARQAILARAEQGNVVTICTAMFARGINLVPQHPEGLLVWLGFVRDLALMFQAFGRTGRYDKPGQIGLILDAKRHGLLAVLDAPEAEQMERINAIYHRFSRDMSMRRYYTNEASRLCVMTLRQWDPIERFLMVHAVFEEVQDRPQWLRELRELRESFIEKMQAAWKDGLADSDPDHRYQNPYVRVGADGKLETEALDQLLEDYPGRLQNVWQQMKEEVLALCPAQERLNGPDYFQLQWLFDRDIATELHGQFLATRQPPLLVAARAPQQLEQWQPELLQAEAEIVITKPAEAVETAMDVLFTQELQALLHEETFRGMEVDTTSEVLMWRALTQKLLLLKSEALKERLSASEFLQSWTKYREYSLRLLHIAQKKASVFFPSEEVDGAQQDSNAVLASTLKATYVTATPQVLAGVLLAKWQWAKKGHQTWRYWLNRPLVRSVTKEVLTALEALHALAVGDDPEATVYELQQVLQAQEARLAGKWFCGDALKLLKTVKSELETKLLPLYPPLIAPGRVLSEFVTPKLASGEALDIGAGQWTGAYEYYTGFSARRVVPAEVKARVEALHTQRMTRDHAKRQAFFADWRQVLSQEKPKIEQRIQEARAVQEEIARLLSLSFGLSVPPSSRGLSAGSSNPAGMGLDIDHSLLPQPIKTQFKKYQELQAMLQAEVPQAIEGLDALNKLVEQFKKYQELQAMLQAEVPQTQKGLDALNKLVHQVKPVTDSMDDRLPMQSSESYRECLSNHLELTQQVGGVIEEVELLRKSRQETKAASDKAHKFLSDVADSEKKRLRAEKHRVRALLENKEKDLASIQKQLTTCARKLPLLKQAYEEELQADSERIKIEIQSLGENLLKGMHSTLNSALVDFIETQKAALTHVEQQEEEERVCEDLQTPRRMQ